MEVQAHKLQIFLLVGILLTSLAILGSCMHSFLVSSEEGKCDTNSDSQPFPKLQKFITEPLSILKRYLIGEGSHGRLLSFVGLTIEPKSVVHDCTSNAVLRDAAVFGDTNLELPSSVSNYSVVEIHVDVAHNVFSGHMNEVEINNELPLHARYPVCPLGELAFSRAWDAETNRGAAAWVQIAEGREMNHELMQCLASSATMVEARAGILVLERAVKDGIEEVCIKTDSLVFVQGLNDPDNAHVCIRSALEDFCYLCVVKVPRHEVKAVHEKAKKALAQM